MKLKISFEDVIVNSVIYSTVIVLFVWVASLFGPAWDQTHNMAMERTAEVRTAMEEQNHE